MSQYNILQAIPMSFYSRKLYRDVAFSWGGKTFFYLIFILALSWIAFTYQVQLGINFFYSQYADHIVAQAPIMHFENGRLTTPENRPYFVVDPDKQNFAVIDTSGQYTSLEQAKTNILMSSTDIITQGKTNEIRVNKYPEKLTLTLNPKTINDYLHNFVGYLWVFFFLVFLFISFMYRILQAILYAICGKIFAMIFRSPVSYFHVLQIVPIAITPTLIINTVMDALHISIHHELLLYFVLSMLYLFYGIMANKPPKKKTTP